MKSANNPPCIESQDQPSQDNKYLSFSLFFCFMCGMVCVSVFVFQFLVLLGRFVGGARRRRPAKGSLKFYGTEIDLM